MSRRLFALFLIPAILSLAAAAGAEGITSALPFGKDWAGGRALPRPIGIGLTYYTQLQDYDLQEKEFSIGGQRQPQFEALPLEVENRIDEVNLKVDAWVLPFLNVYGILGLIDGETTVEIPEIPGQFAGGDIDISVDGTVYGGGLVLAVGGERFFGSLNTTLTQTSLDVSSSSLWSIVVQPQVGVRALGSAFWVGAMYQKSQEKHDGEEDVQGFGLVEYDVELQEDDPWSFMLGVERMFGNHWQLMIDGGVGGARKHASVGLAYRI